MSVRVSFHQALSEMAHHKLRTLLTLLGMVFGVGAVIAMLSVGEGAEREAMRMIETMGVNNLVVNARTFDEESLQEIREDSLGLTRNDMVAAVRSLGEVSASSAEKRIKTYDLFSLQGRSDAAVVAVTPSFFSLSNLRASEGRTLTDEDSSQFAQVAVLGSQAARDLFGDTDPIGNRLKVNHLWLRVVGVIEDRNLKDNEFQGVKLGGESNQVFLPLSTALKRLKFSSLEDEIDAFRVSLAGDLEPKVAALALSELLERRHGGVDDFELVVPAALLEQQRQTQQIFTIVMSCIAGISLLVGGIGIMNIMLATILERTGEIGLLRALGAKREDIRRQFIVESFTISAAGALIGVVFGLVLALAIQQLANWSVAWSITAIVMAVGICLITGVLFGWYPASRAAELDPIRALQSEAM